MRKTGLGKRDAVLEIIGPVAEHQRKALTLHEQRFCIECRGALSYASTLHAIQEWSVPVVIEASCREGIFLPSKVSDYVGLGRPFLAITPQASELRDVLARYGGGIATESSTSEGVARALSKIYDLWVTGGWEQTVPVDRIAQYHACERHIRWIGSVLQGEGGVEPSGLRGAEKHPLRG